jgi:hypothetical protein
MALLVAPQPRAAAIVVPDDVVRDEMRRGGRGSSMGMVRQRSYSFDSIHYDVHLARDATVIENEVYFPGWVATLVGPGGKTVETAAVEVNGLLRGWLLPAGEYGMVASFRTPRLRFCRMLSLASFVAWLSTLSVCWLAGRRRRSRCRDDPVPHGSRPDPEGLDPVANP